MADMPCNDRTAALSRAYRDLMISRILPRTPSSSSTCHSTARGTASKAFLKSTKQQYSLLAFPFCRVCRYLSINDLRMNMLSVVRKSYLKPPCPLALTACFSAHDASLCIIANSLAITEPAVMPLYLLMSDLWPDLYTGVITPTDNRQTFKEVTSKHAVEQP